MKHSNSIKIWLSVTTSGEKKLPTSDYQQLTPKRCINLYLLRSSENFIPCKSVHTNFKWFFCGGNDSRFFATLAMQEKVMHNIIIIIIIVMHNATISKFKDRFQILFFVFVSEFRCRRFICFSQLRTFPRTTVCMQWYSNIAWGNKILLAN